MTPEERALLFDVATGLNALAQALAEESTVRELKQLNERLLDHIAPLVMKVFPDGPPQPGGENPAAHNSVHK